MCRAVDYGDGNCLRTTRRPRNDMWIMSFWIIGSDVISNSISSPLLEMTEDCRRRRRLYELGVQSHRRQDVRTAETLYTAALKLDGELRLAWLQRGRIRLLGGNANLAVADLTRALQLFADDPTTIHWRGDALAMSGRLEDALADYNRSLEMLPESTIVRYNRAVVLRMLGRFESGLVRTGTNAPTTDPSAGSPSESRFDTVGPRKNGLGD